MKALAVGFASSTSRIYRIRLDPPYHGNFNGTRIGESRQDLLSALGEPKKTIGPRNSSYLYDLTAGTMARYYLGLPHQIPKLGKYGTSSKLFHVSLILLALVMIVSGISLSVGSLGWASLDQNWQRRQRLLHDFGSYGFMALIAAHVFWQFLKRRRPQLNSMITGKTAADTFSSNHNWARWKPDVVAPAADPGKADHEK